MKRLLLSTGILAGGYAAYRMLSEKAPASRGSCDTPLRERLHAHMRRMFEEMPEDFPPKLIRSILPRLAGQNDEILALLREQNALIRDLGARHESGEVV